MPVPSQKVLAFFLLLLAVGFVQPQEAENGGLFLPEGFEAIVVVESLEGRARHLAVADNGDIYVKARRGDAGTSVTALRDTDGDGRADVIATFGGEVRERNYGTAARIYNGYLYFSTELVVYRYKLTPGQLVPEGEAEIILTDDHAHGISEHIAKPLAFDGRGNMYVPFGAHSNCCQVDNRIPGSPGMDPCPLLEDHGGIWKFDANKLGQTQKDGTRFATGLRSVVGMEWNPTDDNLYAVHHGRDDLLRLWPQLYSPWQSALLPSEEFFKVKEGFDGGWPYCYYDQMQGKKVLNPEYGGDGTKVGRCDKCDETLIGFPGHWAPNDLHFYRGNQFPERYRNGAFIAFHGSTNRGPYPQSSYFIGFVPFRNGKPSGDYEVFADGFAGKEIIPGPNDADHRPMGIAMGPDGAMYFADTEKGKIWKVSYTGKKRKFPKSALAAMEKRKAMAHIRTPDEQEDNLNRGKVVAAAQTYQIYCAGCHQRDGRGDSQRFPPLDGSEWVTGDKSRLIGLVLKGLEGPIEVKGQMYNGVMPQHGFLEDDKLADILSYVRTSFGNDADAVSEAEVAAVRRKLAQ